MLRVKRGTSGYCGYRNLLGGDIETTDKVNTTIDVMIVDKGGVMLEKNTYE